MMNHLCEEEMWRFKRGLKGFSSLVTLVEPNGSNGLIDPTNVKLLAVKDIYVGDLCLFAQHDKQFKGIASTEELVNNYIFPMEGSKPYLIYPLQV